MTEREKAAHRERMQGKIEMLRELLRTETSEATREHLRYLIGELELALEALGVG